MLAARPITIIHKTLPRQSECQYKSVKQNYEKRLFYSRLCA